MSKFKNKKEPNQAYHIHWACPAGVHTALCTVHMHHTALIELCSNAFQQLQLHRIQNYKSTKLPNDKQNVILVLKGVVFFR